MKRTFAMSDIHGQFDAMERLLSHVSFDPIVDHLVVVGDLIDRGPHSGKVVRYLKKLQETYPQHVHVVLGNHEIMMRDYVFDGRSAMWLRYGGYECIADFNAAFSSEEQRDEHLVWLANLPLYIEDEQFFYTHAGLDPLYELDEQIDREVTFMTLGELYHYTKEEWKRLIGDRKVVHGHTPYHVVYDTGQYISCDLGASVLEDGKLALIDLSNDTYYAYNFITHEITQHAIAFLSKEERFKKTLD